MTKKRRRGIQSDWALALKHSRDVETLRRDSTIRADSMERPRLGHTNQHQTQYSDSFIHLAEPNQSFLTHPGAQSSHGTDEERNPALDILIENEDAPDQDREREVEQNFYFQPFENDEQSLSLSMQNQVSSTTIQETACAADPLMPCAGLSDEQLPFSESPICQRGHEDDYYVRVPDLDRLERMRRIWENRFSLTAMLSVVGSVRYTVSHYDFTRNILMEELPTSEQNWPPYSRTQRYFREVLDYCLPESHLVPLPTKSAVVSASTEHGNLELDEPINRSRATLGYKKTEKVRVFLPSAWAKLDIATSVVFEDMFSSTSVDNGYSRGLENCSLVRDRESITGSCNHILINCDGRCMPCGPGSSIEVSVQRQRPISHTPYIFRAEKNRYTFKANIVGTWCVAARGTKSPSSEQVMESSVSPYEKLIVKLFTEATTPRSDSDISHHGVLPGDICTLLSSEQSSRGNECDAILVHRFWRVEDGTPSILILWVRARNQDNEETTRFYSTAEISECHVVRSLRLRRLPNASRRQQTHPEIARTSNYGRLEDGTPFVVYRMLLYCDDFQKSSQQYPTGSAGGCYFLPLSLPPEKRRSTSSVRIVSLTPPGVSTNEVLNYIIDDLVHGTVCGVDGCTPSGNRLKIFLDVVGFVGDYPAAAGTIDVIGHVGRAPCTLCSFRRPHASEVDGSRYGYTTTVHAGNSTFLRHAERHISLRKSDISDAEARVLGMITSDQAANRNSPLLNLYKILKSRREGIPKTVYGRPVVPGLFDPYRCNVIAPDHLLTGLCKDILNTVYECIPTEEMRLCADTYICAALRENGLLPQREVFNLKKKVLHSMTLSELYCVILVASPVLLIVTSSCPGEVILRDAVSLMRKLQDLIGLTYWWPRREIDGEEADQFVHRQGDRYTSELRKQSKEYVKEVDTFCTRWVLKKGNLDKPNLHRLIELYEHTIPAFGHVREFMELVFEAAHQPLKRCIANSNNHDAHIFAVEHCVGNDWQGRLAALSREMNSEDPSRKMRARRGLRRLLLGAEADMLDETRDKGFIVETDRILEKLFSRALQIQFKKDNRIANFAVSKSSVWKGRDKVTLGGLSRSTGISRCVLRDVIRTAVDWLNAIYPPSTATSEVGKQASIQLCRYAKRVSVNDSGTQIGKPSGFDVLSSNCVVQAQSTHERVTEKILRTMVGPHSTSFFFIILAVLHRKGDLVWVICSRCSVVEDRIQIIRGLDKNSFQILCLTTEIRRVAVYHVCQEEGRANECDVDIQKKVIRHSKLPFQGGPMYFQTRREGYPPRQG